MTDKERLEEIKERRGLIKRGIKEGVLKQLLLDDVSWLIEQVQELENEKAMRTTLQVNLMNANQKNKQYREAIQKAIKQIEQGKSMYDVITKPIVILNRALESEDNE